MPLKVIRRPYQDCAYRWALSTSGISVGEGDCSEAQCADLNGDFNLDFSACDSKAGKLVWAGDCIGTTGPIQQCDPDFECGRTVASIAIDSIPIIFSSISNPPTGYSINTLLTFNKRADEGCCQWFDEADVRVPITVSDTNEYLYGPECGVSYIWHDNGDGTSTATIIFDTHAGYITGPITTRNRGFFVAIRARQFAVGNPPVAIVNDGGVESAATEPRYEDLAALYIIDDVLECADEYELTLVSPCEPYDIRCQEQRDQILYCTCPGQLTWPSTITARLEFSDGSTGPETNDRIRSKWHLEYDIEAQLWTLRSFERIDYPVYTLSDASPCDGDTKTLLLADKGDAADGCGVAPAEVTITRVCPPDRVGKSALLEDRKPNGATGKRKRQCGCDCLDEVDDRRQCATKCASAATEGCERIDPAPDDITCRYPEAINCCANTAGKDVPCAYTVEFECDLFFDIEDVRHKIAAKQVVLRRECYFEDPCLFVAPGAESSTGGSPVMDTDGFPGAQPVCASCSDPCLTGCTWSAWTVAACPTI